VEEVELVANKVEIRGTKTLAPTAAHLAIPTALAVNGRGSVVAVEAAVEGEDVEEITRRAAAPLFKDRRLRTISSLRHINRHPNREV
jgi:hypothetical protein